MTQGSLNRLLCHIRRAAQAEMPQRSDGELLASFIERREEAAFATLLRRHGPMVLGVCRRILDNAHDAEDAFQATFLVLVRKAASIRPREAVGNWLYGVAYRTALEARSRIARRRTRERQLMDLAQPNHRPDDCWLELQAVLDRELHRLPDKYRLAVVLCDVEGRSRRDVARQLAIPEGTLSSRLAVARKKLAARLARYGFALTGVSLAALLTENAASAYVPSALLLHTSRAATLLAAEQALVAGVVSASVTALTEGVVKTMFVAKIKTAMVVVCSVAALGLGTGGVLYQTRAGDGENQQLEDKQAKAKPLQRGVDETSLKKITQKRRSEESLMEEIRRLRDELAAARDDAEKLRAEAMDARRRAEEAVREVHEQTRRTQQALREQLDAKRRAEIARSDAESQQIQRGMQQPASNQGAPQHRELRASLLDDLKLKQARLENSFARRRRSLEAQRQQLQAELEKIPTRLKELDAQYQKEIADLDNQIARARESSNNGPPSPQRGGQEPSSGDKVDRILERLERMERRLERLERDGPPSNRNQ